jgi:hypothetical protein
MTTIEELQKEIAMFPNDEGVLPKDKLINYDYVNVGDVYDLLVETDRIAREEEREKLERAIDMCLGISGMPEHIAKPMAEQMKSLFTHQK